MIVWLTGNSGSGKTTIAQALCERIPQIVWLDGEQLRASISTDCGFSKNDRVRHNIRVARLAKLLCDQGHLVVVSVIAPFRQLRKIVTDICNPRWVWVQFGQPELGHRPYEPPLVGEAFSLDNNQHPAPAFLADEIIRHFGLEVR